MQLLFATNNTHKAIEIQKVLPPSISILTLKEAGIDIDIPEPHDTLQANAAEKARTIFALTSLPCFGEDTGLEVTALHGEPGVRSARYAGDDRQFENNMAKLLYNLKDIENRTARFRTVICLRLTNDEHYFEGVCEGNITTAPMGDGGFGYDALFIPKGATQTFAQMSLEEKNRYSHRRKATDNLVAFLNNLLTNQTF